MALDKDHWVLFSIMAESWADRSWVLGQEVPGATGCVVRISDSACGRTSRTRLAIIRRGQSSFFLGRETMLGQTAVLTLMTALRASFTDASRACPFGTCALLARSRLAAVLACPVLAAAAGMTGLVGVRSVKVSQKESIDNRTPARHPDRRDHDKQPARAFHGTVLWSSTGL